MVRSSTTATNFCGYSTRAKTRGTISTEAGKSGVLLSEFLATLEVDRFEGGKFLAKRDTWFSPDDGNLRGNKKGNEYILPSITAGCYYGIAGVHMYFLSVESHKKMACKLWETTPRLAFKWAGMSRIHLKKVMSWPLVLCSS